MTTKESVYRNNPPCVNCEDLADENSELKADLKRFREEKAKKRSINVKRAKGVVASILALVALYFSIVLMCVLMGTKNIWEPANLLFSVIGVLGVFGLVLSIIFNVVYDWNKQ